LTECSFRGIFQAVKTVVDAYCPDYQSDNYKGDNPQYDPARIVSSMFLRVVMIVQKDKLIGK